MNESLDIGALIVAILAGAVRRGTPIAYAALGECVAEKSGILNLGVEGMMLVGAVSAYMVQSITGNPALALLSGALAAALLSAIHAILVLWCNASQVVSGFAVTILGTGFSGFVGRPYVGKRIEGLSEMPIPGLQGISALGPILFQHDVLVYLSVVMALVVWFLLYRTRFGLNIRAVGEAPESAYAQGVKVTRTRFLAVLIGGLLAGIGGAHLSIAYTQVWAEHMTAGQGWIAIGLVIVARWHPVGCLLVAWFFGFLLVLHPHLQAAGLTISPYLIAMLPYLFAVLALLLGTILYRHRGRGMPEALMINFTPGGR